MQILLTILLAVSFDIHPSLHSLPGDKLPNGWYYISQEEKGVKMKLDKTDTYYYLDPLPIVVSKNFKEISFHNDRDGNPYLKIQFDAVGTKAWKFATMRSINRKLGFVFQNKLLQCPTVNSEIEGGVSAIWDYSKEELILIKSTLEKERDNAP